MRASGGGTATQQGRGQRGRNQQLVLEALKRSDRPLGAYELLRALRNEGMRAPLQVYRALGRLIAEGSVHKIESVSAYAACSKSGCHGKGQAVFAVCTRCGLATQTHDSSLAALLTEIARNQDFRLQATTVELSGLCEACADT